MRAGDVRPVDALGRNLAVFRGASGAVAVLDAHCPHQGASLAAGRVDGDTLTCPFHRWAFDTEGALRHIPGLDRVPRARLCAHPVVERHGIVWMWHHASGRVAQPGHPLLEVPTIAERGMVFRGEHDAGAVAMHISEFAENSVDFQHFAHVHGGLTVPWTTWTIPGFGLEHRPRWYRDPDRPHVAVFEDESNICWRGAPLEQTRSLARVTMHGPGGAIWFHFMIPGLGELVLFQTHLPVAPLRQRVHFRWFSDPAVSRLMAWIVVGQWVANWKADLQIWQNKVFRERPVLVSLDGPVREMRSWYAQFGDGVGGAEGGGGGAAAR